MEVGVTDDSDVAAQLLGAGRHVVVSQVRYPLHYLERLAETVDLACEEDDIGVAALGVRVANNCVCADLQPAAGQVEVHARIERLHRRFASEPVEWGADSIHAATASD